ncbi:MULTISPECIES: hypothetical protein [unclassified Flavobacterium]|uniref:hypothetical protein n=1 Tax=unclassified Flavobacterium TaxID=196869 RepID=UPI000869C5F0|nr:MULTISPECIES: hypothetical protein [unclassified Flavobacterium]MBN9284894.1 hypothetical protein [Flavobacterium sp.]ODS80398.1 MAG: hypothetical protein ABS44_20490 [Chryseobacterium sp. SCN 40-13]OJV72207.1 MAG: hypothetical protein BGO42_03200 [Flavobacterium sp. 40-81]
MTTIKKRLEEINQKGLHLDTGELINESFENYKKIALTAGLAFLIVTVILAALVISGISVFYGIERYVQDFTQIEQKALSKEFLLISAGVNTLMSAIMAPFIAGILKLAHDADMNRELSIGTTFDYYKSPKFKNIFLASFLIALLSVLASTLLQLVNMNLVGTFVSFIISFLTFLTIPLIIFGDLSVKDAITISITVINKKPLTILLAIFVAAIGSCVGIIAFCLGIFFTIPYIYSMYYTIYKNIFGAEQHEIEEIGNHEHF